MRKLTRREAFAVGGGTVAAGSGLYYAMSKWQEWFGDVGVQLKWEAAQWNGDESSWPTLEHDQLATSDRNTWKRLGVTAIDAAQATGQGIQAVAFTFQGSEAIHVGYMQDGRDFFGTPTHDPSRREVAWRRGDSGDPLIAMGRLLLNGPDTPAQFEPAATQLLPHGTTIEDIRQAYPGVPYLK